MTEAEFEQEYFPRYDSAIRAIARKLAQTNDALADDLYQEGLIALWHCEPRKAVLNVGAYIRQSVKFRMIDFMRREKLNRVESLDARLSESCQVVRLDDGSLWLTDPDHGLDAGATPRHMGGSYSAYPGEDDTE